jgi:hypothetical protein
MDGTPQARDTSQRFVRTSPDTKPAACEHLAKTYNGLSITIAIGCAEYAHRMDRAARWFALPDRLGTRNGHVFELGPPSTLVPSCADDAFAVAIAQHVTGYPGELLWAKWAGGDWLRPAAAIAWRVMSARGEVDPMAPTQRGARRAVLHGVARALHGRRGTASYRDAARRAHLQGEAFRRLSMSAEAEIRTALAALEPAYRTARWGGSDFPPALAA